MRVLIIGSDTPVGQALRRLFTHREREFLGLKRSDCRWNRQRGAKKALRRADCDLAIDLRLQASADGGLRVHEIDVDRSRWLANAAEASGTALLALSCARVFSGAALRPYREDDPTDSTSSLGKLLISAETEVRRRCERHAVLRMGPVFAPTGINAITHMLNQINSGETLHLSKERRGSPVAVEDAAWVISALVDQYSCGVQAWGNFHYCSAGATNCHEFGEVLLAAASQFRDLNDEAARERAAPQAFNWELDCTRICNTFAVRQQPWRTSVIGQVKQFYAQQEESKS